MTFDLIDPGLSGATATWLVVLCIVIGVLLSWVSVKIDNKNPAVEDWKATVGYVISGCTIIVLPIIIGVVNVVVHNSYMKVWDERIDLKTSDVETTMATIIEESGEVAVVQSASGESFTVRDGDTVYDNCEMQFSTLNGDTVDGWVECTSQHEQSTIAVFGKDA